MDAAFADLLSGLQEWSAALPGLLQAEEAPGARAAALAELLRRLAPPEQAACRLQEAEGRAPPEAGASAAVVSAEVSTPTGLRGELRLGLSAPPAKDARARLALFLELAARFLSLELQLEESRQEQAESASLAMLGEAMAHVAHAVGNHLNSMLLQAAVIQMRVDPARREELGQLRREGTQAANRLRPLQEARTRYESSAERTDLAQAIAAVLAGAPDLAARVRFEPGTGVAPLPYPPRPLRRLVTVLLHVALSSHAGPGALRVTTAARESELQLVLDLTGPHLEQGEGTLADLPAEAFGGLADLERSAAEGLVRRLNGRVVVLPREGGVSLLVAWPAPEADVS
jgi:hypothetical protein